MVTVHSVMLWPIHRHQCFGVGKAFHKEPNDTNFPYLMSYTCGHTESETSKLAIQVMNVGTKTLQNMQFYL